MKKVAVLVFALAIACFALVGCGNNKPAAEGPVTEADGQTIIKVGASPAPHADILKMAQEELAKENIKLEIVEFTDYILPNKALSTGEIDANFFQHLPYLNDYNAKEGSNLVSIAAVHFEPLAVYPGKAKSFAELADGATVAVPNDTTNEARALKLLEAQGLIKLKEGVGLEATPRDIVENPKNLKFHEVEAAVLPASLADVDLAVINGNFALGAGLDPAAVLATEDKNSEAAKTYANCLVVNAGNAQNEALLKLAKVLTSPEIKKAIDEKYQGAVVAVS